MKHQVVWPKVSVTNKATDEELILDRGELLPDWVDDFTLFTLVSAGGVKAVEELDPALVAQANPPDPVPLAEHPLPSDPDKARALLKARQAEADARAKADAEAKEAARAAAEEQTTGQKTAEPVAPPATSAVKADWVTYAVTQRRAGVSEQDARAEAEAMSKADLIAAFGNGSNGN